MKLFILLLCCPLISGEFSPGSSAIVHLFEWKWNDIADECERFLAPMGFAGVQVSPPSENAVIMNDEEKRPWWERYQVVTYDNFQTRSGSKQEYKNMIRRCNKVGVRIYADVLMNHMTGSGEGVGTGGTPWDGNTKDYPGVPYTEDDFNARDKCPSESGGIEDYNDIDQVKNCELVGLRDLDQSKASVREALQKLLNSHLSFGVAGFRFDAVKHMWPEDMEAIFNGLDDLSTENGFPPGKKPFIYHEVIDMGGEAVKKTDFVNLGVVTEFVYGYELAYVFRKQNPMKYLDSWGEEWGLLNSDQAVAFIDNHDNQRGSAAGGRDILTFREPRLYKMAVAFMCAHPYGYTRLMSSYDWEQNWQGDKDVNDWIGPPHDGNYNTLNVPINPDGTCGNGWVCEHRWRQIYNMVRFRNAVEDEPLSNWWSGSDYQIAFSRGTKGFLVINNEDFDLNDTLQTGLPEGSYCDVISGNFEDGKCTGKTIKVNSDGTAEISISASDEDPFVAIHVQAKLSSE